MEVLLYIACILAGASFKFIKIFEDTEAGLRTYNFRRLHDPCIDSYTRIERRK